MGDITVFGFEKLVAWQESKQLVKKIYKIVEGLPGQEQYGLGNQIKRAALSVASNLAEGTGRTGFRDQAHFSQIAYGSLMEVACQSLPANLVWYHRKHTRIYEKTLRLSHDSYHRCVVLRKEEWSKCQLSTLNLQHLPMLSFG